MLKKSRLEAPQAESLRPFRFFFFGPPKLEGPAPFPKILKSSFLLEVFFLKIWQSRKFGTGHMHIYIYIYVYYSYIYIYIHIHIDLSPRKVGQKITTIAAPNCYPKPILRWAFGDTASSKISQRSERSSLGDPKKIKGSPLETPPKQN